MPTTPLVIPNLINHDLPYCSPELTRWILLRTSPLYWVDPATIATDTIRILIAT